MGYQFAGSFAAPTALLDDGRVVDLPPGYKAEDGLVHYWVPEEDVLDMADRTLRRRLLGFKFRAVIQWEIIPTGLVDGVETPGWEVLALLYAQQSFQYTKTGSAPFVRVYGSGELPWAVPFKTRPEGGRVEFLGMEVLPEPLESQW